MSHPIDTFLAALREGDCNPHQAGSGWAARCPAHQDRRPSLSIGVNERGDVLCNCHAGCTIASIVGALGLRESDLFTKSNGHAPRYTSPPKPKGPTYPTPEAAIAAMESTRGKHTAKWSYQDKDENIVGYVVRWDVPADPNDPESKPSKNILPASLIDGVWHAPKGMPTPRPLYRLPDLLKLPKGSRIWVVEGEKAADAGRTLDLVTTTSPHGAESPDKAEWSVAAGQDVVILPDNDAAGEKYAAAVVELVTKAGARSVRVVRLPDLPNAGDIVDFIDARDSRESADIQVEIDALATATEPISPPTSAIPDWFAPVDATDLIRENPEYRPVVIDGLLREGETINIIAAPKVGKSWLVLDMALAVALGLDWFGRKTSAGKVMLIDLELHRQTLARRFAAVCKARSILSDALAGRVEVRICRGKGMNIDTLAELIRQSVKPGEYRMIVLDALYRLMPPGRDENSNTDMQYIYNVVDGIADHTGAAIPIVHHATKGRQDEKRPTDMGAGGGSQSRAADSHLVLRPHQTEGAVVVEAVVRSFPPPEPFVIRENKPGWTLDTEGLNPTELWRPPPRPSRAKADADTTPKPEPWTPERFVREFLKADPTDQKLVKARARAKGIGVRQTDDLIALALADRIAHTWTLPPDRAVYLSIEPQSVTAAGPGPDAARTSLTRARPPRTPRETQKRPRGRVTHASQSEPNTGAPPLPEPFACHVNPAHAEGWRTAGSQGSWTCAVCHPPVATEGIEWSEKP